LLKNIEEFGKYVAIVGFKNAKISDAKELLKTMHTKGKSEVETQFFDATVIATWEHLYFAVLNAVTAFVNGENISKSLAVETLLYASTQHQIQKAMELVGIRQNTSSQIAVLVVGEKPETVKAALTTVSKHIKGKEDDSVLELTEKKMAIIRKAFGITDLELKTVIQKNDSKRALTDIVIERMALLATQH
jgi:tRNA threonylcarbamoyladenosine modification (KEOPS) complex Cgi121 subunit